MADESAPIEWHVRPGDRIKRTEVHKQYGGGGQGGISPSARTPNVISPDPRSGEQHGYFDRWVDGVFLYTGEGQRGDQVMKVGNRAVLEHAARGRALRMFEGTGGIVKYLVSCQVVPPRNLG